MKEELFAGGIVEIVSIAFENLLPLYDRYFMKVSQLIASEHIVVI